MQKSVRQIAKEIGVSPATVSRVLNNKAGVAEGTRETVLRAVGDRGLLLPKGGNVPEPFVGIIVPELENPTFGVLASAIEKRLAAYGVTALIGSSTLEGLTEMDYIATLMRRNIQGLVLVSGQHANPSADQSIYWELHRQGMPMVLVNGQVPGLAVPTVVADEAAGAQLAVDHLAELGHERIALAGGQAYLRPSQNRLAGYCRAMRRRFGRVDDRLYTETIYSVSGGHAAARKLLSAGTTAIITGSDLMALGAVAAVREAGLSVPADVSVVGYDDSYLASHSSPSLTTIRQPLPEMASVVATSLWEQLQGYRTPDFDHVFPLTLVARGSTAAAPVALTAK
ncbi:LacI family DNA-binding transcriptional regulator [Arthrobacter sp. AD-310]